MSPTEYLFQAFAGVMNPSSLMSIFLGAVVGELVGILPGLSSPGAIALLLPVSYGMSPANALAMLVGIWYGSTYGGIITSVLLNIPGEGDSVIATLDGYQLHKKGRGALALGVSAFGGFVAGTLALILLQMLGPAVAAVAIRFGPPDMFALMVFGLSLVSWLSGKSITRGLVATALGLLIGTVGMDLSTGEGRLTFGVPQLMDGIGLVPAIVGLFGLGEVLHTIGAKLEVDRRAKFTMGGLLPQAGEWKPSIFSIVRGTIVGFSGGIIPGVGPTNTTFISYGLEKKLSKTPDRFGEGAVEGVAGPGAASHAATIAGMIPLLSLGIPASGTAALLIAGFMVHGLFPGPLLYSEHPELVWSLIASLYVGNVMLLLMNTVLIPFFVWLVDSSKRYVSPLVGVLSVIGAYSLRYSTFDLWLSLGFGVLGYLFRVAGFPLAPLVIALVLGNKMEVTLRQSLVLSGGDPTMFFSRPASAVLLILAMLVLVGPVISFGIRLVRRQGSIGLETHANQLQQ